MGPAVEMRPVVGLRPLAAGQLMTKVPDSLLVVLEAVGEESWAKKVPVPAWAPFWPEQPEMVPVMVSVTAPGAFLSVGE